MFKYITTVVLAAVFAVPGTVGAAHKGGTLHLRGFVATQPTRLGSAIEIMSHQLVLEAKVPAKHEADQAVDNAKLAGRSPLGVSGGQLRLPDATFSPAGVNGNYTYPLDASTADGNAFRGNHWWSYSRMGMTGGYYERADAQDNSGGAITFRYQASIYPSANGAFNAFKDGYSRTSGFTPGSSRSCVSIFHVPCFISVYALDDQGTQFEESYVGLQVNNCLAETTATAEPSVYNGVSNDIATTQGRIAAVSEAVLKSACNGRGSSAPSRPAPAPVSRPRPAGQNPPKGNCYSFRSEMWNINQRTSDL